MIDCLKVYNSKGKVKDGWLRSADAAGAGTIRWVDLCGENLTKVETLLSSAQGVWDLGPGKEFQWEVPPLYGREQVGFAQTFKAIAGLSKKKQWKFRIVANDAGVPQTASEQGVGFILGRAMNKSFLRLSRKERFGVGNGITLDAVMMFLPEGPPVLPWSDSLSLDYLIRKGLSGFDLDGETALFDSALRDIKGRDLDIFLHLDDVFSATGRHCFYKAIQGRCTPGQCSLPRVRIQYGEKTEKGPSQFQDTKFHFRGKTLFRAPQKPPETLGYPRVKITRSIDS